MKSDTGTVQINRQNHWFELYTDGKRSIVAYEEIDDNTLDLIHTEVDSDLEGQGIGSKLVRGTLDYIRANHLHMIPTCPFVRQFVARHPEYQDPVQA
jgi:uncharacterized protein